MLGLIDAMLSAEEIYELGRCDSVKELEGSQAQMNSLNVSNSELLGIANDMFKVGSKSHLRSLNPLVQQELGLQLQHMTSTDLELQSSYQELKNKYISLGRSFSSISFLFDLVSQDFVLLDILLMHELLMDDGHFRKDDVYIQYADGSKQTFSAVNIEAKLVGLFEWYNLIKNESSLSNLVIATLFHYYLIIIHPFSDGNGRVSRLFLNLILIKDGLFPIVISDGNRKKYYDSLIAADSGDFSSLINFIAGLQKEKIDEYLKLARDLSALEQNINCLVLTEDGNTEMIENLLDFHDFDLNRTAVESYFGKDNIASAVFLARKMKEKNANVRHIIFHRDRDNEQPQTLKQILTKFINGNGLKHCSTAFITKFYDMESYFINAHHISEVYPEIAIARSEELVDLATFSASKVSKKKLRTAYLERGRYGRIADPEERASEINALYESDTEKYRYGKEVLFKLEELITSEISETDKVSLVRKSRYIKIEEFEKISALLSSING